MWQIRPDPKVSGFIHVHTYNAAKTYKGVAVRYYLEIYINLFE